MSETFQVLMNLNAVSSIFDSLSTQYPFAVSKWLNALANDGQAAMRARLKDVFSLRRVTWNIQGIKIAKEDRASKTSWRVVIQVAEDRDYLDKFEELGYHIPRFNRYVWIPNEAVFGNRIIDRGNPLHPETYNSNHLRTAWSAATNPPTCCGHGAGRSCSNTPNAR